MNTTIRDRKPYKGIGMEGWIAHWYNQTRQNDLDWFLEQARNVANSLPSGADVLEVAPGPGFFAIELAKLGQFNITGLDISQTLVQIANGNARKAAVSVMFRQGNASEMPFANESFDFIYCSAAFKNFSEPVMALDEMHRVLRSRGKALIVDLRQDTRAEDIDAHVKTSGRSPMDAWLTKLIFKNVLIKRAYSKDNFTNLAQRSLFGGCEMHDSLIGFAAYLTR